MFVVSAALFSSFSKGDLSLRFNLRFKLLLLLCQHLFLNHQIKGHNHNYGTSTDKISPPLLIIMTVASMASCLLHFGEHLRWIWSQWKVTGSATVISLKILAPVWAAVVVCITYFHAGTLGPPDSLRNNKHFILSK